MALAITLPGLWGLLLSAPDAPLGRLLRRALVEAPARQLAKLRRGAVMTVLLLILIFATAGWLLEGDAARMFALAAPEITALVTGLEIATYVDAVLVTVAVASTVRLRGLAAWIGSARPRARRRRPASALRPRASNDDADGPALLAA